MLAYAFSCDGTVAAASLRDDAANMPEQLQQMLVPPLRDGNKGGGTTLIDTNKTCFSCFRIPTLLAGQSPGVVHAFAEARRAGLETSEANVYHCPDGPDTRLVQSAALTGSDPSAPCLYPRRGRACGEWLANHSVAGH